MKTWEVPSWLWLAIGLSETRRVKWLHSVPGFF